MIVKIKHVKDYQAELVQLKNHNMKFGRLTLDEHAKLVRCFESMIEWWRVTTESPEEISIEQYDQMTDSRKQVLLDCLSTPQEWIVHSVFKNVKAL
tara:strand:+ start:3745 stop:4032 length:288 start_codon:yes stop_codon:yes gene_type:complete